MIHTFVQGRFGEILQITKLVAIRVDQQGRTLLEGAPLVSDALTVVMLALVVCGAFVTYKLVEVPGQLLSRSLLTIPRTETSAA
jgi:peptidoglycan/LPS O-acetylase OafA/YrhL